MPLWFFNHRKIGLAKAVIFGLATLMSAPIAFAQSSGPDVIVGNVDSLREDSRGANGLIGLTASTDSFNVGDMGISWHAFPSVDHPVIVLNLYRELDGQFTQVAQSWVKHGFLAVNDGNCPTYNGRQPQCVAGTAGPVLQPGCSDLYGAFLNANPRFLGPRSKINPSTGAFGQDARDLTGYPNSTALDRIMTVTADVIAGSATDSFYLESIYISGADAQAGHSRNNASYRKVDPEEVGGVWYFNNKSPVVHGEPAIAAWSQDGQGLVVEVELDEGNGFTSYLFVGSNVSATSNGRYRYDYMVFNLNSDAAVERFSLPIPADRLINGSERFQAPTARGEIWSKDAWRFSANGRVVAWSTDAASSNENANAIRWGTGYSFSFESEAEPEQGTATIKRFKDGSNPASVQVQVVLPKP